MLPLLPLLALFAMAAPQQPMAAIDFALPDLDGMSVAKRNVVISQAARKIRTLTGCAEKGVLASELADAADDAPDAVLQEITTTYAEALNGCRGEFDNAYAQLARLVRHAHMHAPLDDPRLVTALAKLDAEDREIAQLDFTLTDLNGTSWTLKELRGKVVLLNFWNTGCPPCVSEMPALGALSAQYQKQGLIVLGISNDEDAAALRRFAAARRVRYPVLPDAGGKVTERYRVVGIPHTMVFNREGKLVEQFEGSRTQQQFTTMLGHAGMLTQVGLF